MVQIHQLHPSIVFGDAISNEMREIQKILQQWGYKSDIYGQFIHPKLSDVKNYADYKKISSPENILLVHYSIAYSSELFNFINSLQDKLVLIYHNITPSTFFNNINYEFMKGTAEGRKKLENFRDLVSFAIAHSEYSRQELIEKGFKKVRVLPIVKDFEKYVGDDKRILEKYSDDYVNILFVGRIVPNKKYEDIIKTFYYYRAINPKSRLFLVGSYEGMEVYRRRLQELIKRLRLRDVYFTGHINFDELISYYKLADIFLCMSEHEGFCVPLLESMFFKIPIIAYNSTAIPYTLGNAGILINEKNYVEIAEMINLLVEDKKLRGRIVSKQTKRLKDFDITRMGEKLKEYLELVIEDKVGRPRGDIRVEGTFEDSYSLSIVNRELALALDKTNFNVSLFATTGGGDYTPESITDGRVKELWLKKIEKPEFVIRNIYPPRIEDMEGKYRLIYFFWEESMIPSGWVEDFNDLDGIIVPSRFVKKVLEDSGVRNRIQVIPPGLNSELFSSDIKPKRPKKKFVFFNIGSGFPRKGIDILVKAYTEEFDKGENVCLVLKSFPNPHNNIKDLIKEFKTENSPEIVYFEEDNMPELKVLSLYKSADCFVSPTRGEGFGLPIAEAILSKIPVVVTNHGGHIDFCSEENSFLINSRLVSSKSHLKVNHRISGSLWAEPDIEHLKLLMRYVFENKNSTEIREKVERAYADITIFSWDNTATKTIEFLEKIKSRIKLGMVSTWNTKCGIAEYTKYLTGELSDKIDLIVLANHENPIRKDEPNVIRCWNTYFDDLDQLYQEVKGRDLEVVHFQFNFSFFELKTLLSLIKRLKNDGIKTIITFHSAEDAVFADKIIKLEDVKEDLRLVDRILVHSNDDIKKLSSLGINENVILIPHGNKIFPNREKKIIRKNIFCNSKIISTFGFFLPHKGILETIKAAPMLIERYPDVLFLVISAVYPDPISKKYCKKCKKEVKKLGLEKNVLFFTDYLDEEEIVELLQASDIVVMPYRETNESSSAAIRFPLSSHRPIMVTKIPIFKEFDKEVYKIERCSPELIAKGITNLYENEKLREEIVSCAIKKMENQSWQHVSKEYERMIVSTLNCA